MVFGRQSMNLQSRSIEANTNPVPAPTRRASTSGTGPPPMLFATYSYSSLAPSSLYRQQPVLTQPHRHHNSSRRAQPRLITPLLASASKSVHRKPVREAFFGLYTGAKQSAKVNGWHNYRLADIRSSPTLWSLMRFADKPYHFTPRLWASQGYSNTRERCCAERSPQRVQLDPKQPDELAVWLHEGSACQQRIHRCASSLGCPQTPPPAAGYRMG